MQNSVFLFSSNFRSMPLDGCRVNSTAKLCSFILKLLFYFATLLCVLRISCNLLNLRFAERVVQHLAVMPVTIAKRKAQIISLSMKTNDTAAALIAKISTEELEVAIPVAKTISFVINTTDTSMNSLFKSNANYLSFQVCPGRLGNQMYQYAAAYGIAKHNNRVLVFSDQLKLVSYFTFKINYFQNTSSWPEMIAKHNCMFDEYMYNFYSR